MDRVLAIGTSQGGVEALGNLIRGLSEDFPLPILVVLHIGAGQSLLPSILNDIDGLIARFARQGEPIEAGHIYVAPPDRHMLVRDGHIELARGPKENWARPAVDPLFRSVAGSYGAGAIGIVLSGRLNDGTAGLYEIKRHGGTAVVQTPSDAAAPDMPRSALENVSVDYCLPVSEMPRLLMQLARQPDQPSTAPRPWYPEGIRELEEPSAQACPECGGAMRRQNVGSLVTFRCHIGHVMTAEVLAATQLEGLQDNFSSVLRLLNERGGLSHEIAEKYRASGNQHAAAAWDDAANQAIAREELVQRLIREDWLHPEAGEPFDRATEEAAE